MEQWKGDTHMSFENTPTNTFRDGRKAVLAEVRECQDLGLWTYEVRASWLKSAISHQAMIRHNSPYMREVITYYAGRISALKSWMTADFCEEAQAEENPEYESLLSNLMTHQQERLREATVYTHADSWYWEEDEEDEQDWTLRERMLLVPSPERTVFKLNVTWLGVSAIVLFFWSAVPLYQILFLLISLAALALEIIE
jgi:hypothetical protein